MYCLNIINKWQTKESFCSSFSHLLINVKYKPYDFKNKMTLNMFFLGICADLQKHKW